MNHDFVYVTTIKGDIEMRKITPPIFFGIVLLLTACGGAAPATQPPAASVPPQVSPTQAAPTAQPQPTATEAVPASSPETQVTITLADNTISTSQTTFQAGVPYSFVITNNGHRVHNFIINPPVSAVGSLDAALSQALLAVTKDQLGPGATATVQYTFPDTAVGQQLEFSCLIQRHYDDGMRQEITVTK
jgi:uncharacterized cupredoxin-like copper-binding protein